MIPLKDTNRVHKFPFWTILIIFINFFVFYLELTSAIPELFILQYALIPSQVDFGSIQSLFPFVTSQFLHGGFLHIFSNMIFLWVFGNNVEASFGRIFYPIFYLLSGIAAAIAQYIFIPFDSVPMLGASGAVAGVLGAYFARFPFNRIKTLVFIFIFITIIDIPAFFLLIFWFITQLFSGVASITLNPAGVGGIAFASHIGGFIFGWLLAVFTLPRRHFIQFKYM